LGSLWKSKAMKAAQTYEVWAWRQSVREVAHGDLREDRY